METREIYRLAYRRARCSLAIMAWADNFHEAYEFESMTEPDILKQIARIDHQREAYNETMVTLSKLEGDDQMIDDIDLSACRSVFGQDVSYRSVMHRVLSRWSTTRPGELGTAARRDFLNEYAHALARVRDERLRNPNRFQLRYHWRTKAAPVLTGKGE